MLNEFNEEVQQLTTDEETGAREAIQWPNLEPLLAEGESEPYPKNALPPIIKNAVDEVEAYVKAPYPMIASSALGVISLAVQALFDVSRDKGLSGPTSLYFGVIAASGERKSTVDNLFFQPIRAYQKEQWELAQPALKEYQAQISIWESKRAGYNDQIRADAKAIKDTSKFERLLMDLEESKPIAPRIPQLMYSDATPEALTDNLHNVWPSGGVIAAEGGLVLGSHGMNTDSIMRNLSTYNQLWDGSDIANHRKTTKSFTLSGARLTMVIQTQSEPIRAFFKNNGPLARGIGFFARFLITKPTSTQGFRPYTKSPVSTPHMDLFVRHLKRLLNEDFEINSMGGVEPRKLPMSPEAQIAWEDYYNQIESELSGDGELYDIRDVAAKSADNAARIASVFQAFIDPNSKEISLDNLDSGAKIAAWHLMESKRFFSEVGASPELLLQIELSNWISSYCKKHQTNEVSKKTLLQRGPSKLRDKPSLDPVLRNLESKGYILQIKEVKKESYLINPELIEKNAS